MNEDSPELQSLLDEIQVRGQAVRQQEQPSVPTVPEYPETGDVEAVKAQDETQSEYPKTLTRVDVWTNRIGGMAVLAVVLLIVEVTGKLMAPPQSQAKSNDHQIMQEELF